MIVRCQHILLLDLKKLKGYSNYMHCLLLMVKPQVLKQFKFYGNHSQMAMQAQHILSSNINFYFYLFPKR
jgi:hypothetical protein